MKKKCLLLILTLLTTFAVGACSAKTGGGVPGAEAPTPYPSVAATMPPMGPAEDAPASGESGYGEVGSIRGQPTLPENAKLILRAAISVESTEFDAAVAALDQLVAAQGGYYESNEIQQGTYYDSQAARYGSFTVRVPQAQFEAFLNAAGAVGHVISSSKSSQDVGEEYFDAEARLKTQQTKHERLLSLLEKADSMENIIALENALSETEYQMEQLSGTLRKYDSLVGYSTITIRLQEVLKLTEQPKETLSFGGRLSNAFQGGVERVGENMSNLAVWVAYHFVGVGAFLLIAAAALTLGLRKRRRGRSRSGAEK